ncbi:MAG: DUF2785 domain-containing protein, partial [Ktedonobacteraceae bacterium]|nr:DUF2785 domain-containing protein [Ktedonobacteraceae bacterium]
IDHFTFARALLANFASPDSELRDELSYRVFTGAIIEKQRLSPAQLQELLTTALDKEHLFYRIGETGADSVFMRSFSSLVVASILYVDAQKPALPAEIIRRTKDALLLYARQEKDWRGYVKDKGWAHAMAHLADALDGCAQHSATTTAERKEILTLLRELATINEPLYHEEDVRLALVAYHIILGKQVADELITSWIDSCYVPSGDSDFTPRETNSKNFLRSLYFYLLWDNMALSVAERISDLLLKKDGIYLGKGAESE